MIDMEDAETTDRDDGSITAPHPEGKDVVALLTRTLEVLDASVPRHQDDEARRLHDDTRLRISATIDALRISEASLSRDAATRVMEDVLDRLHERATTRDVPEIAFWLYDIPVLLFGIRPTLPSERAARRVARDEGKVSEPRPGKGRPVDYEEEARTAWNLQADDSNRWSDLDEDERRGVMAVVAFGIGRGRSLARRAAEDLPGRTSIDATKEDRGMDVRSVQDMSNEKLAADLERCAAAFDERGEHGGSPGESAVERIMEIETEQRRRGVLRRETSS